MIISHRHRFIFIKTTRTAGTSIEIALSKFCGPRDVITPISRVDETLRQEVGGRGPQNWKQPIWRFGLRDWGRLLIRQRFPDARFYNHIPATAVRRLVPQGTFSRYYKFCAVRNPWDRLISLYWWHAKNEGEQRNFGDYLRSRKVRLLVAQELNRYTEHGNVLVDRLIRYEDLEAGLEDVRRHLGIAEPLVLANAKGNVREDRRPYQEVYTDDERQLVAELCADEIRLHGYEF